MNVDPVEAIAEAVLYEGHVLWPYRRSAPKNRQRWTFGAVSPRAWSESGHSDDRWRVKCECLLQADEEPSIDASVRFLQVVRRSIRNHAGREVDSLTVEGEDFLTWEEASERRVELRGAERVPIGLPAGAEREPLPEQAGAVERNWHSLRGVASLAAEEHGPGTWRVRVEVENLTSWKGGPRTDAQALAFNSLHVLLRTRCGAFTSLTDPPPALAEAAGACQNDGLWPALVGDRDGEAMLAAPIILPDYPQVAPESPGDLFDSTEIDQLLILNTLSLTPTEQREVRASDPRARELLDRCAALESEQLLRLHRGAFR